MVTEVTARKTVSISGVVVAREDVEELATRVHGEYRADAESGDGGSLALWAFGSDGISYKGKSADLYAQGGVLETKRIEGVRMWYRHAAGEKEIEIHMRHGRPSGWDVNVATVSGGDEIWVRGVTEAISSCVASWKKQAEWPHRYFVLLTFGSTVAMGETLVYVARMVAMHTPWIVALLRDLELSEGGRAYSTLLSHFLAAWGMVWPAMWLMDRIRLLYPAVEFAMGPGHLQAERTRRIALGRLVSLVVAPVGLVLLGEFLRRVFG